MIECDAEYDNTQSTSNDSNSSIDRWIDSENHSCFSHNFHAPNRMHSSLGFQEVYSHIGKLHYCTAAVKNSIGALISEIPECKCEKSRNLHIIYLGKHDWNIHARWLHIDKLDRDIT